MRPDAHYRVPGEDVGKALPTVLLVVGVVCTIGAVELFSAPSEAASTIPQALPPPAAAPAPAATSVGTTASSRDGQARGATQGCAPLVVTFPMGSRQAAPEGMDAVDGLARWLTTHPDARVLVHGHADSMGNDDANLKLSKERAQKVAQRIEQAGVAKARITARGFGSYQPVEGEPEDAASNRRVNVYVRNASECPNVDDKEKAR